MNRKVKNRKRICLSDGVFAPNALCGHASLCEDDEVHRCMAHGNLKCKHRGGLGESKAQCLELNRSGMIQELRSLCSDWQDVRRLFHGRMLSSTLSDSMFGWYTAFLRFAL